jgi:signal transduction histidine kinase
MSRPRPYRDSMTRFSAWLARLSMPDRIAVGVAVLLVTLIALTRGDEPTAGVEARSFDVGAAAILAAGISVLLLFKRFPGTAVIAVIALTVTWYQAGYTHPIINLLVLIAYYRLGLTGDRKREIGIGGATLGFVVVSIIAFSEEALSEAVNAVAWPVAALLFGELIRNRRLLIDEYAERARTAEAKADQRVAEERLRIAHDVHDVLAHTVSAMTVQAGVAADTLDRDPKAMRHSLANIRAAGKEAMAEVRATIAVLRDGGEHPNGNQTAPAPRLDRLPDLADRARARGLEVELHTDLGGEGPPGAQSNTDIESLVELTAYRIVQEGLTNVIRHADASRAEVSVTRGHSELIVEVRDNGRTSHDAGLAAADGTGFGLRGMHERLEPLGGALRYGPRPEGGWEVVARIPTGGSTA